MVLVLRLLIYGIITEVADRRHACGNAGTTTTFKRSDGITIICLPLGDNYNDYDGTSTNHHRQKQQQQQQLRSLTLRITTDNNSTVTKSFDGIIPQQQHHLHHHNHKEDDHQGGGWKPKRHEVREENSHKANTKKLNINEDNDGEADEERVKNKKDHHRISKSSNNFDSSSNVNSNRKGIELKNSKSSEVIFVDDNISNENDDRKNSKKSHKSNDNENNDDNVDNNSNNNLKRNVHSIKSNNENEKRQNFKRPRKKFDSIKIGDLFDENFNNNSNDEHTAGGGQNDDEIEQYIVIKRIRKKKMRKKSADKDDKHLQDDDGDNDGSKLLNVDDVDFVDFDGNRMLRLMSSLKNFNSSVHQDYQNQTFRGSLRNDADNHIGSSSKISSTTTTIKFLDGLNRINSNLANQVKLDHDNHREHYGLNRNRIFKSNKQPMFSVVDAGRLNIDNENLRTDSEEDLILKKFNNAINDLDQEIVEKKNADQSDQSIVIEYQPNIRNKEKNSEERIQSKSKPIETTPLRKKSLDPKLFIITVPVVSGAPKSMDSSKSSHQHQSDHDLKIEKEYQKFLNVFNFKPEDGEHSKDPKKSSDKNKVRKPSSDFKSVEVTRVVFSNDPKSIDSRKLDTISDHNANTGGDDRFHKEFRQSYEFRKNTETTEGDLEGFLKHWPKDLQLIKSSTTQNTAHQSNINGRNSQFASTNRFGQDPHRSSNHQINLLRQHQQPKRSPPPLPPWSTSSELFNANNQELSKSNANDHSKNLNSRRPNNKQYFWKMMPTR
ncbi:AT-rich interactive domain-containing protein 4B [Sarcoptes scabiei]|nr:AT-rich interactive domain-containing protein 4B [Sarcoptes scabiei]